MSPKNVFSVVIVMITILLAGCSEYASKPTSFTLPTSNKNIDVVLHRSDVRFTDCGTLTVIQTYDGDAKLIDAQSGRGVALHCNVIQAGIEAGGRIGAAAVLRPAMTKVNNAVNNSQSQGQTQTQSQTVGETLTPASSASTGGGDGGGSGENTTGGGNSGSRENNGFGNGGDDGVPGNSGHDDTNR
ncbi:MAG TPA: hypothetical protein VEG60_10605 [Candidatus Binatia bacterium]|nr:hypothetical protein [Candidatus Binatia bacterium]